MGSSKHTAGRRTSEPRQRARRRRVVSALAVLLLVFVWARFGPALREQLGLAGPALPEREAGLRVITWNLANFSGDPEQHDLERMAQIIAELDPDIIAVQEVKQPEALAELLPQFELRLSEAGGRGQQHLGLAYRRERVELLEAAEHTQLSLDGRVRPGLSAYLRGRDGGPDLWLLVVHLKAMPDGIEQRRTQWKMLASLAGELALARPDGQRPDRDLLVLGDFNSTGPRSAGAEGPAREQAELARLLGPAGLRLLPNATGCSAYYDGARRDAWKEPSEIDLIWARGLDAELGERPQIHAGTHCAAQACKAARSSEAYPLHDYAFVSDHCPLILDLGRPALPLEP